MAKVSCKERMIALAAALTAPGALQGVIEHVEEECPEDWNADYAVVLITISEPDPPPDDGHTWTCEGPGPIIDRVLKIAAEHFGRGFKIMRGLDLKRGKVVCHTGQVLHVHDLGGGWEFELEAYRRDPKKERAAKAQAKRRARAE